MIPSPDWLKALREELNDDHPLIDWIGFFDAALGKLDDPGLDLCGVKTNANDAIVSAALTQAARENLSALRRRALELIRAEADLTLREAQVELDVAARKLAARGT